tara:strand:- start:64 stop:495 length:432 start_codon:yes stop_codon:yes gene_type:complete
MSFDKLSIEIIQKILKYLNPIELRKCMVVCKLLLSASKYFLNNEKYLTIFDNNLSLYWEQLIIEITKGNRFIKFDNFIHHIVNVTGRFGYDNNINHVQIITSKDLYGNSIFYNKYQKDKNFKVEVLTGSKNKHKSRSIGISLN